MSKHEEACRAARELFEARKTCIEAISAYSRSELDQQAKGAAHAWVKAAEAWVAHCDTMMTE